MASTAFRLDNKHLKIFRHSYSPLRYLPSTKKDFANRWILVTPTGDARAYNYGWRGLSSSNLTARSLCWVLDKAFSKAWHKSTSLSTQGYTIYGVGEWQGQTGKMLKGRVTTFQCHVQGNNNGSSRLIILANSVSALKSIPCLRIKKSKLLTETRRTFTAATKSPT